MRACRRGPSRNTTSRDQAPSHLAGTQTAHGTASRSRWGRAPTHCPLPPSPPCMTQHWAPSALQGFSCWAHFSSFCPGRGSWGQGGGCLNGWSPPRNASPGDGQQAGLRAWTPSPGAAPRPRVARILGRSSDAGLLPGRWCIQPGPALQGVGRVSPKCRGGSWRAALKAPRCSREGVHWALVSLLSRSTSDQASPHSLCHPPGLHDDRGTKTLVLQASVTSPSWKIQMEPQVPGRTQRLSQQPLPGDSLHSAETDKGLGNMQTGTHKLDLFPLGFF